jgi:multicomponent Na+:H+ antiporter subunit D
MISHAPVLVILLYFLGALLIPLFSRRSTTIPWALAVLTAGSVAVLSGAMLLRVLESGPIRYFLGNWKPPIGIELVADPLSAFITCALGTVATLVLFHGREAVERDHGSNRGFYYSAALLVLGGFVGIVGTGDLFNLYVFLEISSLASYALLGSGGARSAVGAFRYLILGTIGASFYLIGLGFILIQTGSLNMADVAAILATESGVPTIAIGLVFITIGIGLKMALFPMHHWLPDAYTFAPATSTALIAPIGTKVAAYVLIRMFYGVFPEEAVNALHLPTIVAWLGAIAIIWGSVMAIPQDNLKRMLAYSSVAQIGYIALGLGLGSTYALIGAVLHIVNHACMKSCLFLVSSNLETRGHGLSIKSFGAALRREMPLTSAAFAIAAISMIGLPPTAGFFSKWYLLLASFEANQWPFVIVILVSSLLNAVYFFRVLERMYLGGKDEPAEFREVGGRPFLLTFSPVTLALSLFVLGLGSGYLVTHVLLPMVPFLR